MATKSNKGLILALVAPIVLTQASPALAGKNMTNRINKLESELSALKMQVKKSSSSKSLINSGNDNVSVTVSGQVNRALILADDVKGSRVYNVDNDMTSTRFRILGRAKLSSSLSAGSNLEVQFEPNSSTTVSQVSATGNGSDNFTGRKFEVFFDHKTYGKISLGKGSTASDNTAENILSDTWNVSYSYVPGGFFFRELGQSKEAFIAAANAGTIPTVGGVFDNFDGLGRDNRLRYDTPTFNGFKFSTSYVDRQKWDFAPSYHYSDSKMKAIASFGLAHLPKGAIFSSSAAVLSKSSGLNASAAWSRRIYDLTGRDTAYQFFGQLGWKHKFFKCGSTNMFLDYVKSGNQYVNDDKGMSSGLGFEQKVDSISTDVYASVRYHHYEQKTTDFHRILTTMVGARVKF